MHELIPLHCLFAGQSALVEEIVGNSSDVQRLHEIGLCRGAAVEMVQPGTPCVIRLGGNKLCFRQDDLMSVLVRAGALT